MAAAGVEGLNRVRDDARRIAPALNRADQQKTLDRIIGALAGTREADLVAPTAQARARGRPYDSDRVALFEDLAAAVQRDSEPSRPPKPRDGTGHATLAFFEAYFSNYIEGTGFTVEEAEGIVFKGHVPQERPADAARHRRCMAVGFGPRRNAACSHRRCGAYGSPAPPPRHSDARAPGCIARAVQKPRQPRRADRVRRPRSGTRNA